MYNPVYQDFSRFWSCSRPFTTLRSTQDVMRRLAALGPCIDWQLTGPTRLPTSFRLSHPRPPSRPQRWEGASGPAPGLWPPGFAAEVWREGCAPLWGEGGEQTRSSPATVTATKYPFCQCAGICLAALLRSLSGCSHLITIALGGHSGASRRQHAQCLDCRWH